MAFFYAFWCVYPLLHRTSVGASLLAKRPAHPTSSSTVTPPSRAGSLPQEKRGPHQESGRLSGMPSLSEAPRGGAEALWLLSTGPASGLFESDPPSGRHPKWPLPKKRIYTQIKRLTATGKRHIAQTTRFRPLAFAWYSALSAANKSCGSSPYGPFSQVAMPILTVMDAPPSVTGGNCSTASRMF